jgi:deoxycytidylate deaminase
VKVRVLLRLPMSQKECQDRWYQKHKKAHIRNVNRRRNALRKSAQQKTIEYLKLHPCVDCGEKDIVVLQFDHVRGKKKYEISTMISTGYSWTDILKEIEKCDVRCANDHIRRTSKVNKSYRSIAQR